MEQTNFNLIFFQNGLGQKRTGIEKTVQELADHYSDKQVEGSDKQKSNKKFDTNIYFVSNTGNLKQNLANLYSINYDLMILGNNKTNTNKPNINIGGDHSMGIGSVGASLNKYGPDIKVIWIDAHADINTRTSSPSGNVHGMPLSFLTGLDSSADYDYLYNKLPFVNLCYIGIRDLDTEEIEIIKKYNIKTISVKDFNNDINTTITNIINWVDCSPVHVSFDVDSLDPTYIQYTGTRASGGLELEQLIQFIKNICLNTNVINFDLSELNLYNPDCVEMSGDEKIKSFENFNLVLETICSSLNDKSLKCKL